MGVKGERDPPPAPPGAVWALERGPRGLKAAREAILEWEPEPRQTLAVEGQLRHLFVSSHFSVHK